MPITLMRDSSRDYRTYWLQGGQYYSKMRNLGDLGACELPSDKLSQIPEVDRNVVAAEASADPAFCARLSRVMKTDPNWVHTISDSAKKAIANELDPKKFPESHGMWPKLRELSRIMVAKITSTVSRSGSPEVAAKAVSGLGGLGDLGQWDIVASLVGAIGGAATSIYSAKLQTDTQKKIAQMQLDAQRAQITAQQNIAASQAAMNPLSSVTNILTKDVAGVPAWVILLGAGGALYFFLDKK